MRTADDTGLCIDTGRCITVLRIPPGPFRESRRDRFANPARTASRIPAYEEQVRLGCIVRWRELWPALPIRHDRAAARW